MHHTGDISVELKLCFLKTIYLL